MRQFHLNKSATMIDNLRIIATYVAIIIGIFYVWAKYKLNYWQRLGVPTFPTNIFFGNFKDCILLRQSPAFLLGRLHNGVKSDWPFLGLYIMQQPFLLVRDPKLIKHIFIKDFNIFHDRWFATGNEHNRIDNDNLFSLNNPEWKYMRAKITPTFTTGKIKQLFNLMVETADNLKNFVDKKLKNQENVMKPIEVKSLTTRYTTDIISSFAFGINTNSFCDPPPEFYVRAREQFLSTVTLKRALQMFVVGFFPRFGRLFSEGFFFGVNTDYIRNVFWDSMNARESANVERTDISIMDVLMKLKNEKEDTPFKFEGDSLVAQSGIFYIAGIEASSVTMSFALYEIARHPDVQERMRAEIHECLKDDTFKYESVQKMKYVFQVIKESSRLYPSAPILDRVANEDYKIPDSDVTIKKGTVVYVALPGIHRDPRYFSNPDKFDPERFSDERKHEIEPCTYMPFGEGPRSCLGYRVGVLQIAVCLAKILKDYEISVHPQYHAQVNPRSFFTTPLNGIDMFFKKLTA